MADAIQTLLVSLEARIAGFEREMKRASSVGDRSAKGIEARFKRLNSNISNSFNGLGGTIAKAFAGAAALRGAQVLIDTSTRIENSLKVAGLAGAELTRVYDTLFISAQKNAAPLEALVDLYGKASLVQKDLGVSTQELLGFTENVAVALRVSGKSASESSGALLQLSQLLGSGTVRAEEFNSVQEGALPILQAVASGMKEAGGSVSKLRTLVVDGKISSEAFFRAFEAGSSILTDKVAGSEMTVSQGFIRLQNVLIDTAGKFDNAIGLSAGLAKSMDLLGVSIANLANGPILGWLADLNSSLETSGFLQLETSMREVEAISSAIGGAVDVISDSMDRFGSSVSDADLELAQAEQSLANFAQNSTGKFGELDAVVQDLIQQLLEGRGTAESAATAIAAIGTEGKFDGLLSSLGTLVDNLFAVRDAANAAAAAAGAVDVSGTPQSFAGQDSGPARKAARKQIVAADYAPPGSKKGKKAKSAGEKYSDTLKEKQTELDQLREQTALQSTLNPLIDDYGYAVEKLKIQQELQLAAQKAGISLTPELKGTIDQLAVGYATATVEAAKLAETQDQVRQTAEEWRDTAKSVTRGFIDDLVEGKSALESLGNALTQVGNKLLDSGLDMLFGGGNTKGFGSIGKLFGFAGGGYTGDGGKNQPAGVVHKGEYVFTKAQTKALGAGNLAALARGYADAGLVGSPGPVVSRQESGGISAPVHISIDATGADSAGLARLQSQLSSLKAELPSTIVGTVRKAKQDRKL